MGISNLGGGNSNIFDFHPNLGEMIQFDEHIFQMGWFNHQLVISTISTGFSRTFSINRYGFRICRDPKLNRAIISEPTNSILEVGSGGWCRCSLGCLDLQFILQFSHKPLLRGLWGIWDFDDVLFLCEAISTIISAYI